MTAPLLRAALRQRGLTLLGAVLLIAAGLSALAQLQIEAYPDISDTQVVVVAQYPGRATEEVEQQVTIPLERALNSTPRVMARRSRTIFGLAVVELTFEFGTDDQLARQMVLERLRDVDLPPEVTPSLGPLSTPIGELFRYTLSSPRLDSMQLRELQDWVIEPRFLQVPGVADVVPFGGTIRQFQIQVDPQALQRHGLTITQVADAVAANNRNAGGALLDTEQQSMAIRGVGRIESIADIERVLLKASRGVPLTVGDIGRVTIGPAPRTGMFGIGRDGDRVQGIVLMRRGENPTQVLESIKEAAAELNRRLEPEGAQLEPIYDRTDLVENTLHTVVRTLLEGLAVVILVLLLFLGSARAAILTAITIPLSLLFAFVCMRLTGIPANLLSLGALDFGILVDGTLVMVEHVLHRLAGRHVGSVPDLVREAALEVERPIFFSLLILIAAYLPLFTLERVERRLFTPMAFTVSYALVGSMLLALTLIPVLATYFFRNGAREWKNPLLTRLEAAYARALAFTVGRPALVAAAAMAVVAIAFGAATRLGSEFLPQLDEGVVWVRANLRPGVSLAKSASIAGEIRGLLAEFPEIRLVSSQTGRNDAGTDPYGPNRNEFFVALEPYDTWPGRESKAELVERLAARLRERFPQVAFSFTQPIVDNVTEAVTGSAADLAVIISGPDLAELRRLAGRALEVMRTIPGAADTAIEQEDAQAQLRIRVRREAANRYGVSVGEIQEVIELALGGRSVSTLLEGERRFDIVVRYTPEARRSPSDIGQVRVSTPDGARIALAELAEIGFPEGASIIARRENRRQVTVRTNIRGRDQGSFVADAQKHLAASMTLPEGYRIEWGGQFENLDRARKRLGFILPVTIALIGGLLFFAFGSARFAGLVLMTVPFSLVGGMAFLMWRGINLSVSAAVGFISLFGVAVMSGVLIVAEINRRRHDQPALEVEQAVALGAAAQLRPVLLMIVVALLGMVPAARATGIGSDVQRPLATVVVGGLLSTLLLTLVALPALYVLLERRRPAATMEE